VKYFDRARESNQAKFNHKNAHYWKRHYFYFIFKLFNLLTISQLYDGI